MAEIVPGRATGLAPEDFTQTRKREETQRQAQQKAAKAKADQEAKKREAERQAKLNAQYVNPAAPLATFIADPAGSIARTADAYLGTDIEQTLERGRKVQAQRDKGSPLAAAAGAATEAKNVLLKGVSSVAEGVLNVATQPVLDLTVNRNREPDTYLKAAYDFGVTPKTEVGKASAKILGFIVATRAAARLPLPGVKAGTTAIPAGLKGGAKVAAQAKRLVTEGLVPGAIADFFLTDPRDGNFSSMIQSWVPEEWQDNFVFALAAKEEDNPWINRIKSVAEGGPLNAVGNAVVAFAFGKKAAKAVIDNGGSKEEAVAAGVKATADKSEELAKADAVSQEAERVRWTDAQELEMNQLMAREQTLQERINALDPEDDLAKSLTEELDQVRLAQADLENTIFEGADDVPYEFWETQAAHRVADINDVVKKQDQLETGFKGTEKDLGFQPGRVVSHGASGKVMTDAQLKIMNLDEGVEKVIKNASKKVDVRKISRAVGKTVDEVVGNAARVYQDFNDAFKTVDEVMQDPTDVAGSVLRAAGGTLEGTDIPSAEGLVAAKAIISDLAAQIYDIARVAEDLDTNQITGANNFDRLIDRLVGMLEVYKFGTNFYGGSLNSLKVKISSAMDGGEAAQALREFEGEDVLTNRDLRKWADKVKNLKRMGDPKAEDEMRAMVRAMVLAGGDPAKTVTFAGTAMKVFGENQMGMFYNSILSGTKTIIRNFSASVRLIEAPVSIAIMGARKGDPALTRAAVAGLHAIWTSSAEAFKVGVTTFKSGTAATWTPRQVIERAETEAMLQTLEKIAATPTEEKAVGFLKAHYRLVQWLDFPTRLLMSTDDAFRTILARQRIAEQSMYQAMTEAKNPLDVDKLAQKYIAEYSKSIDPQTGRIKAKGLAQYAEIGTFQEDPGKAVNGLSQFLENLGPLGPLGRVAVPFLRTPANIIRYQAQFTPLVGKYAGEYLAVKQSGDALRVAEYEGREAIGAISAGIGLMLGAAGLTTGNMPVDARERARWKALDIQPRSINIGGNWVSYNGLEPLNNVLAGMADIAMLARMGLNEDWLETLTGQMALAIAAGLTEKSYFAGLEAIAVMADPGELLKGSTALKGILATSNNMLPLSGARRAAANAFDPYMREFNGELDRAMQSALPGYRNLRPPLINVLTGEPLRNPNGGPWNALVPFEISPDNKDPVAKMLMAAEYNWSDSLEKSPSGRAMTAEQKYFIRNAMAKNGLRQELDSLRKQSWFKEDLKNWQNRSIGDIGTDRAQWPRFYAAIDEIWQQKRKLAFQQMEANVEEVGLAEQGIRKAKYQIQRGQYNLSKPLTAEQLSPTDEAENTRIYNELINYGQQ